MSKLGTLLVSIVQVMYLKTTFALRPSPFTNELRCSNGPKKTIKKVLENIFVFAHVFLSSEVIN